ncbi:hypothetical protein CAPTEDRAFT_152088 [Capitella teleta]|uniref:Beta-lactamase-related domain-containing protein n=1 Tax=Capitella teleta TaxID=283909 RepID=R7T453_CAPTE|nr:hypothetical protein CAPTEDRAFT_152088 [Capitella teleta]|eukprot:ELT87536.1 hypothetical protein CAPTEDRAFT_152088 [Capitella teleta]
MKIASISKPITMAMVAKQWEAKKLDLDADVASFVEGWPTKTWDGEKVSVTARQLANHMSGVRNYLKLEGANQKPGVPEVCPDKMQYEEYFITDHFKDVNAAMGLFKNDALVSKPGTEFLYSNHGYTVLAACIESATKEKFTTYAKRFFKDLDMKNTYAEDDGTLMYNRSGQYTKTQSGVLINAPYVNPSFKIAGAGMWSSAIDLTKFGNAILSSYQNANASKYRTLLLPGTVRMLWTPAENVKCYWSQTGGYGLGWQTEPYDKKAGRIKDLNERFFVGHTGGTVGASSILWMLPSDGGGEGRPKGVVVAMISNLNVNMRDAATDIAKLFEDL